MANNEDDIKIVFGAEADESSAEQTGKKLRKSVEKGFGDDGRIKVPVDITVPIDNTKKKLTEAQKDITSEISKMMAKGFSASGKDIDNLTSKFNTFTKALDAAGKGRQNKIFREIRRQVEELRKSYKALKTETNSAKPYTPKATNTKKSTRQTARDRYLDQQEQYSKRAQGAGERAELNRELDEVRKNKSNVPSSSNFDPSRTNEHLMRLSEYSAHGSNWANELARALKEEVAKAAKTLVTKFDKNYEIGTEIGEKSGKIVSKKSDKPTDERTMLTDVITKTEKELSSYIKQLEAGSEDITLDMLKESAAVIKVLTRAIGKTTEDAEKIIIQATQGRYDQKQSSAKGGGKLGGTDLKEGQEKGVGPGHENTQKLVAELYKAMKQWDNEVFADKIAKEITLGLDKTDRKTTSQSSQTVENIQSSAEFRAELNRLNGATEEVFNAVRDGTTQTANVNRSVKIGNTKEAVEDDAAEKISKEHRDIDRDTAKTVKQDVATGFNTDAKADELITLVRSILQQIQKGIPTEEKPTENKIQEKEKTSDKKDYSMEMMKAYDEIGEVFKPIKNALLPLRNSTRISTEIPKAVSKSEWNKIVPELIKERYENQVQKSTIYASPLRQGFWKSLEGAFEDLTGTTRKYEEVLKANADEQDKMAAERIRTYGLNNGRNPNDTGDIAGMRRILQLYRTNKASIEQNPELAQRIKLTPGREIDTTELTKALNNALSGKNMRNAQMGGSIPRQILGGLTGFIGMPSLEKSRAQADGLNQILGNINKALQSVLINIQTKETELAGMEASGQAKFTKEGYLTPDSTSAAFKTLADLEEEKLVLDSIKADLLANDEIIKRTGGRFSSLVKNLNYTSPVLKENNGILRNINSGLDKNGKALKFQTRMAEILNYTFQLMSRSIGQMIKNWLSMINPINIIKRLFNDFGSYNVKWQRTMNVIKNNFREIILPFMDKIAQTLVNIIGFLDIISMKIQEAFGFTPISLFDQKNANDFKKTYEEIQNVTAGFDELHDIGSSSENDPDNLLGEIYKPQLSQEWIDLANKIGDLFAGIIKGDLGFGEVMKTILSLLGETLVLIGKAIWDWFKETAIGKWVIEHWKGLLATLLALFVGWQLLKIFGPTLLGTIGNAFKTLLSKVGGWITTLLGASGFGQGIMLAFQSLFAGGKYSLIGTLGEMFTNSAAITQAGSWGSMIGFALVKGLVGVLSIALGGKMVTDAFDSAADKTSYNIGLEQAGGNEEDKKGIGGDVLKGAAGGAAIGFGIGQIIPVVGPLVGAAIGAVVGALTTSLAPAFEQVEVAAREANNEMQKIEHYEGLVQGYSTQVSELEELQQVLNDTLQKQTENVYAEGEQLGITKTRMDELVTSVQNGTFNTSMLSGAELGLKDSLIQLSEQQTKNQEATERLEAAKRKLQKAEIDLAIAEDVAAGNFEMAAARIDYAEAASLYTTEEATKKRIQLYKEAGKEEAAALLQDLTPEQRQKMANINEMTEEELASFVETWRKSSDEAKEAFLSGVDQDTQNQFESQMNAIDGIIEEHQGFWQGVGDTLKEIFTFGIADTWTYNGEKKATAEYKSRVVPSAAVGMNYVPNDGLIYVHQGEAIIPKKYNKPYEPTNNISQAYLDQMMNTMKSLDNTIQQGIDVKGEFRQRGSDLVATVEKVKNRSGNQPLNNSVFAR